MCANNCGDPDGRRLARRKSTKYGEANRIAYQLKSRLLELGLCTEAIDNVKNLLALEEQRCIQQAQGRVESRERYKSGSSNPIRETREQCTLYIDECGHSGDKSGSQPPVFTLGGVCLFNADTDDYVYRANTLKRKFFGHVDVVFHEPKMRNHDHEFRFRGDRDKQHKFDEALRELVAKTKFCVFGVAIRKDLFVETFGDGEKDPYLPLDIYNLAISLIMERAVDWIANQDKNPYTKVIFESQGSREDAEHLMHFARVLTEGTQWVSEKAFRSWLMPNCEFHPKKGSSPLELSDLVARDIFEWVRDGCTKEPPYWDIIHRKVHSRGDGNCGRFGIKVFPDSDIRDLVEQDRKKVIEVVCKN